MNRDEVLERDQSELILRSALVSIFGAGLLTTPKHPTEGLLFPWESALPRTGF
jgi:hypothetical protein